MTSSVSVHCAHLPEQRAAERPGGRCVADRDRGLDNAAFAREVRALAARLGARGIGRGDVVAALLPDRVELVTTMFAAWSLGAALTPVDPALPADPVRRQVADCAAALVVTEAASRGRVPFAPVLAVEATSADRPPTAEPDPVAPDLDDPALIVYPGGGADPPRGVVLDHANLVATSSTLIEHLRLTRADRSLVVLPLCHTGSLVLEVLSVLRAGGDIVIGHGCAEAELWDQIRVRRPTFFSVVPGTAAMRDPLGPGAGPDTSSLRFAICTTAPVPDELFGRFERRYGIPLVAGYGLAEGSVASVLDPVDGPRKPGTVGRPLPGQSVWVVDGDGRRVTDGRCGEVIISGPNVMRGYLGRPRETAAALRDGWLHTGAVGRFDEDGHLTIVDRSGGGLRQQAHHRRTEEDHADDLAGQRSPGQHPFPPVPLVPAQATRREVRRVPGAPPPEQDEGRPDAAPEQDVQDRAHRGGCSGPPGRSPGAASGSAGRNRSA